MRLLRTVLNDIRFLWHATFDGTRVCSCRYSEDMKAYLAERRKEDLGRLP